MLKNHFDRTDKRHPLVIAPGIRIARRLFKKAAVLTRPAPARQDTLFHGQGRSERRGESYSLPYVEPLSDVRTKLADFFNSLLVFMLAAALLVSCGVVGSPVAPDTVGVAVTIEEQKRRDALEAQQRKAATEVGEEEAREADPALQGQDVNLPPLRPVGTR